MRLDRETSYQRFTAGLDAALKPATVPYTSTSLEWFLYDDLTYDMTTPCPSWPIRC